MYLVSYVQDGNKKPTIKEYDVSTLHELTFKLYEDGIFHDIYDAYHQYNGLTICIKHNVSYIEIDEASYHSLLNEEDSIGYNEQVAIHLEKASSMLIDAKNSITQVSGKYTTSGKKYVDKINTLITNIQELRDSK